MCLTAKPTCEWTRSIFHVPDVMPPVVAVAVLMSVLLCPIYGPESESIEQRSTDMSTATATTGGITSGTWKIDRVHSHVGFAVKHMVVSTFRGRFEDYDGALTVGEDGVPRLEGWVAVDSIAVPDENLAAHLTSPDFFDSERYPRIRFTSSAVRVLDGGELEVDGELEIKGQTRPVTAR